MASSTFGARQRIRIGIDVLLLRSIEAGEIFLDQNAQVRLAINRDIRFDADIVTVGPASGRIGRNADEKAALYPFRAWFGNRIRELQHILERVIAPRTKNNGLLDGPSRDELCDFALLEAKTNGVSLQSKFHEEVTS